jgi:outer membrane receptor protein involved in Fe transport
VFNTDHDLIKAWDITNLTLIAEDRAIGLKLQAYVRNLFNKVYVQDQYLTDASSGLYTNTFLGDPRTYGVSVTKKF